MGARAVWISRRAGHTAPGVVLACGLMGDFADLLFDSDCARHDLDLAPCEPLSLAESHSKQQQVVKEMMLESQPKVHTRDLETGWRLPRGFRLITWYVPRRIGEHLRRSGTTRKWRSACVLWTHNLHFHRETAARSLCPRCVVAQEEELVKNKKLKSYKKKLEAFNGKLQTMTEHNDVPKECGLLRPHRPVCTRR